MKHVAAREAKNRFGQLIDDAQREPVTIEKNGRPFAVVQSYADFEATQRVKLAALQQGIGEARAAIMSDQPMAFDDAAVEEIKAAGRKQLPIWIKGEPCLLSAGRQSRSDRCMAVYRRG